MLKNLLKTSRKTFLQLDTIPCGQPCLTSNAVAEKPSAKGSCDEGNEGNAFFAYRKPLHFFLRLTFP